MKITLVNVPHPSIGSRIPREQLPPLGLLAIGGPLIDDGHDVRLIDGEFGPLPLADLVDSIVASEPDVVMFGHSGSSSAHTIIASVTREVRERLSDVAIVYGGVHPTYHWREVLRDEPAIDVVVRGEGEETVRRVVEALKAPRPERTLPLVAGIAYRADGKVIGTSPAPVIRDFDAYRVGWELIDHARYSYWGNKRAVVVQFSRGCPHLCNYCGQSGFWTKWRHRDPEAFAAEIARLHREHGVKVFNFADENPSAGRKPWLTFLRALVAEDIDVTLVGSTRTGDIVRDRDELHLYKRAGFERFLLGMESPDEATLKLIRKGATPSVDREAVRLLRQHGILSMATWVTGFEEETHRDMWRGLRQIVSYDPDQIQALYVTPHRWTPFYGLARNRRVIETDRTRWDYKHQVLEVRTMPPWQVFAWVKFVEAVAQLRPRALARFVWRSDPKLRHATRWYYRMGRRVWFHEIAAFLRGSRVPSVTLEAFWGVEQSVEEKSMLARPAPKVERAA